MRNRDTSPKKGKPILLKEKFSNSNAMSFKTWLFRSEAELDSIAFFFISKRNATNARFLPLFDRTESIRIVYFYGSRIPYTDRFSLLIFRFLYRLSKPRVKKYKTLHIFSLGMSLQTCHEILHYDDPLYTPAELSKIQKWFESLERIGAIGTIVCTNTYTKTWLRSNDVRSKIWIVEQGYFETSNQEIVKNRNFSCVYSSPYIHYGDDKHGKHSTWGAEHLIDVIIPNLILRCNGIQIYLIGEIGKNAKNRLSQFGNVITCGRVDFRTNQNIMQACHIGIYPRTIDHKRSVQKIFEYIGAGLPIVTYDLTDTEIVKLSGIGVSVTSSIEFVRAICEISRDTHLLESLQSKVDTIRQQYSWSELARKMENYFVN